MLSTNKIGTPLIFKPWIEKPTSIHFNVNKEDSEKKEHSFTFLNICKCYSQGKINWNEQDYGKLWTYNLNYMDFLLQSNMDRELGYELICSFIENIPKNPTALEPYPIALRGINWIKFLNKQGINGDAENRYSIDQSHINTHINVSLYDQYLILYKNPEYHLLANHLLENGFSLLFGAFYFVDKKIYKKAIQIIGSELNEQILDDGSHFELSPMYHQIILDRLLDCINLLQNNHRFSDQESMLEYMKNIAQKMLSWRKIITFTNGDIPLLNDAAPGVAPETIQLIEYASSLDLKPVNPYLKLAASGYRKFSYPNYECIIDIGQIGPAYQPGHAHADTFNFVLYVKQRPVIVDPGISTYERGAVRLSERGTAAHNTVTIKDRDSSEVWASHRVGRRANVTIMVDNEDFVKAQHNGFHQLRTYHQREWKYTGNSIEITDSLKGKVKEGKAHFWFSPGIIANVKESTIIADLVTFNFVSADSIDLLKTRIPNGYNKFSDNYKVEVKFKEYLKTKITIK